MLHLLRPLAIAVFGAFLLPGCGPSDEEVASSWLAILHGVVSSDAQDFSVLANHYDNGVRIFRYRVDASDPHVVVSEIEKRFAEGYPCYAVALRTPTMLRLRCSDGAAQHWWSNEYEFHVCPTGSVVVGMSIGNVMQESLRRDYETEALWYSRDVCDSEHRRRTSG